MKYLLRLLGYESRRAKIRRNRLRTRLLRIFQMDAISASLDSLAHRCVMKGAMR